MFRRILAPLDGTPHGDQALPYAVAVAARTGATIELVHVHHHREQDPDLAALPQYQYQHIMEADQAADADRFAAERRHLEEKAAAIEVRYGVSVRTRIITGPTGDALIREAREIVADLIVLSTHAREGLERVRSGDIASELVHQLNVPALCVRPSDDAAPLIAQPFRRVLIALDGSEFSEQILDIAAPLVQALGASATLLHVVGTRPSLASGLELAQRSGLPTRDEALDYLRGAAERVRARLPETNLVAVEAIDPARAITQLLDFGDYDLVAVATHGRSGLSRLILGSVAEKIVRGTHRPVLLYRPRAVRIPVDELKEVFRIYGNN